MNKGTVSTAIFCVSMIILLLISASGCNSVSQPNHGANQAKLPQQPQHRSVQNDPRLFVLPPVEDRMKYKRLIVTDSAKGRKLQPSPTTPNPNQSPNPIDQKKPVAPKPKSVQLNEKRLAANVITKSNSHRHEKSRNSSRAKSRKNPYFPGSFPKIAYLTFDDGPSPNTREILKVLRSHGVKATFFVVGKSSAADKQLYKQIVSEGHAIGNHTYTHRYSQIYKTPEAFHADMERLGNLLQETIGYKPKILRFPGGSDNTVSLRVGGKKVMDGIITKITNEGYHYFDWNVNSTDANAVWVDKRSIIDSVRRGTRGKKNIIVLMHDASERRTTVEALPEIITYLKENGFRFAVITKESFTFHLSRP